MRHKEFNLVRFVEGLNGTCYTVQSAIKLFYPGMEEDDLTYHEVKWLNEVIFKCDNCGWWFSCEDMAIASSGQLCNDCADSEGNEY